VPSAAWWPRGRRAPTRSRRARGPERAAGAAAQRLPAWSPSGATRTPGLPSSRQRP